MPPTRSTTCLFCQLGSRPSAFNTPARSPWTPPQSIRGLKTLQKKKRPSRMLLSPSVNQSPPRPSPNNASTQALKRTRHSPFGGMNRTDPGPSLRHEAQKRAAITRNPIPTGTKTQRKKGKVERTPGDMKALRMQRALSSVPYQHRTQVKAGISAEDVQSFDAFGLRDDVRGGLDDLLKGMEDVTPTPIQRLALPALGGFGDHKGRRKQSPALKSNAKTELQAFLLAAETGSGKTLSYTLPIFNALKDLEEAEKREASQQNTTPTTPRSEYELEPPPLSSEADAHLAKPRAIVLLPSAELVTQVGNVFKSLSHSARLRVAVISAALSAKVIRGRLFKNPIDIVIATPALLASIAETTPTILSEVRYLVADEADSLFDRSFAPTTSSIIDRATPSLHQLILCSATIPKSLDSYLRSRFPDITRLATPNLHAIPRRVQLSVVDIEKDPYRGKRDLACADTIWQLGKTSELEVDRSRSQKMILVFVNQRDTAPQLAEYLRNKGIDASALTRDGERSREILDAFTTRTITAPNENLTQSDGGIGRVITESGRTLPGVK
ncbi:MAG: hypothetical protein Q9159_007058, partial [Coniocarpon cinnabarinum]